MIDLHLHTTASDGSLRPRALVERAAALGMTIISVTDHDTVSGLREAREACVARGIRLVDGIEITAVEDGRDVHVLGYFFDPDELSLLAFLHAQREDRVRRVGEMADRLRALGIDIDVSREVRRAQNTGRSIGRPHLANALVAGRHVGTREEAFDRFLGRTGPAFVPRRGARVAEVVQVVRAAGGITSLAHPALTGVDEQIPAFAAAGLTALEARHGDHDVEDERRYRTLAGELGLAVSGGSDFHADQGHHLVPLGMLSLDPGDFAALEARRP